MQIIKILHILLFCFILNSSSLSQSITDNGVLNGANFFYEARFDESIEILQTLIEEQNITGENLFAANLYTAFGLIRKDAHPDTVRKYFVQAINVNPKIEVDNSRIPPDLYEQYLNVRLSILGALVIRSGPSSASILMYHQDSDRIIRHYTPIDLDDLIVGSYELVIAKDGYLPKTAMVELKPNQSDTLYITLEEKEVPLIKKYWPWAGGFVVATSVILSRLFDRETEGPEEASLPAPPPRPNNP